MARHGWAPPGQQASVLGWNYDPLEGWSGPGKVPKVRGLQFDLPIGQSPVGTGQGSGYSLLASPPGMQAPIDMPNYTPGTREVSAPGAMAPIDQLNLTAVPTQQGVPMPFDRSQLSPEDAVAELLAAYGIGGAVGTGEDDDKAGKLTEPTASRIKGPFDLAGDAARWVGDRIGERLSPQPNIPTTTPPMDNPPVPEAEAEWAISDEAADRGAGARTDMPPSMTSDVSKWSVTDLWMVIRGTDPSKEPSLDPLYGAALAELDRRARKKDPEAAALRTQLETAKLLPPMGTEKDELQLDLLRAQIAQALKSAAGGTPALGIGRYSWTQTDKGDRILYDTVTGEIIETVQGKPEFVPKGNKEYKRDADGKLVLINEFEKEPTPFEFKTVGKKTYAVDPNNPFDPNFNKVIFEDTSPEFKTVGDKRIVKIDPKTGVPETVWTAPDEVRAIGSSIWIPKGSKAKINYKDVPAITPQNWSAPAMNWEKPKMGADDLYKWISGKGQDVGVGADMPAGFDIARDIAWRLAANPELSFEQAAANAYKAAAEMGGKGPELSALLETLRGIGKQKEESTTWGRPLTERTRAKFPEISKMLRGENPAPVEPRVPKMELGRMIGSPERLDPLAEGAGKGTSPGIERLAAAERDVRATRLIPDPEATLNAWRQAQKIAIDLPRNLMETPLTIRSQARGAPSSAGTAAQEAISNLRQQFPAPGPVQQAVGKAAQWARPVVDVVGKAAKWADPVLTPLTIAEGLANQLRGNDELSRGWSSAADVARDSNPGWNLYPEEMRRGMETRPGEVPTQDKTISKRQPGESFMDYMARFFGSFGSGQDVGQGADQGDLSRLHDTGWTPPVPVPQIEGMGNKFGQPVDMEGVHKGTDLQAVQGTPAVAPVSGTVINVIFDPKGLGLQVVIQDEQGNKHKLSHLSDAMVKPGDQIQMGQPVGKVGSSGAGSTGPHLDYREQTPDGQYLNPEDRMGSLAQMPMSPNTVGAGQTGPPGWLPEGEASPYNVRQTMSEWGPGGGQTYGSLQYGWPEGEDMPRKVKSVLSKMRLDPQQLESWTRNLRATPELWQSVLKRINPNIVDTSQLLPRFMFEEAINPGSVERQKIGAGQDVGVGAEGDGDGNLNVDPTERYRSDIGYRGILDQIDSERRKMDQQYEIAKQQLENDRYKFDSEMEFKKAQQRLDEEYRRKAQDLDWNKFQVDWSYRQEESRQGRAFQTAQSALSNPWLQNLTGMKPGWGEPGAPGSEGWAAPQPFQEQNRTQMPDWQSLWDTPGQGPNADLPPQELGGQQQPGGQYQLDGSGPQDQRWRPPQGPQYQQDRKWAPEFSPWAAPGGRWSPQGPREIEMPIMGEPPSGPPSNKPTPTVPPGGFGGPSIPRQVGRNWGVQQPSQGGGGQQPLTPTMGFDDWNKLSAFQQAGLRTKEMMKGPGAWESFSEQLRNKWGQGGVKQAPDVSQLSAAAANPAQQTAWGNTADVFGERPDQFWNRQNKGWSRAGASNVSMTG